MLTDEVLPTFLAESRELLEEMESALLAISAQGPDKERIDAVFRAAHTIKGSAGLFGIDAIVEFTHVAESVLDRVRAGQIGIEDHLCTLLLGCRDHIGAMLDMIGPDGSCSADRAASAELLARLGSYLQTDGSSPAPAPAALPASAGRRSWRLQLVFGSEVLRLGMDPLSFLRYLGTLASISKVEADFSRLPTLDQLDPEACYCACTLAFESSASAAEIESVFEFVRQDCTLTLEAIEPEVVAETRRTPGVETQSIRVDADKLDRLIDLVGELIIASAASNQVARRAQHTGFLECSAAVASLVEDVRNSALALRMVRIGATFNRFQRVVHDVAAELGKEIDLAISGEDTELDKTLVERVTDPLTHLVRNAIDHGIETAAERAASGKPARGRIGLHAYHDAGTIVVEVSDDGGGLRRERILAKAIERGIVDPARTLREDEIDQLIFEPGFSTADAITNLSGRGVGMDVVKRNITDLRGSVHLASHPGQGTVVTVRLPLTLAIIDGFQVSVGRTVFVTPLDMVEECVQYTAENGHDFANLRGQVLPLIDLRTAFGVQGPRGARQSIVVVRYAGQRAGLVVDGLLGEAQTVIKPLGKLFQHLECITGSSILGNGDVALILDIPALIRQAHGRLAQAA
ncbi:chemotaxis protein CheA [Massilia sp. TS11]|uniref:chemotaxis protein CheA n=1 Tax=Massilia sp. TS11 TaxID=2908003 RepID=UPI001ED9E8D9|nr:chemotaxis protein CheA [Massilia sp. TS11]MCG2582978.1 chemotaxis protein CheA [Massilia sp. TS11]